MVADVLLAFGPRLPSGLDPAAGPGTSELKDLLGHPALITLLLATAGLLGLSALGLALSAGDDPYMSRLAAATVLAAFSRLSFVFYPSLYSEWVFTGDVLRIGSSFVLLTAAAAEIRRYWRLMAETA